MDKRVFVIGDTEFYQIKGFEEYFVSKNGEVYSTKRNRTIPPVESRRYLNIRLNKNAKRFTFGVHRVVATTFIENPFYKREVNHKDGNPRNNNVENLEWVTSGENIKHAVYNNLLKRSNTPSVSLAYVASDGTNRYRAEARFGGRHYRGTFRRSIEEASKDYIQIRDMHYGKVFQ